MIGRTKMAQYLSMAHATPMEPSLKMLLVRNIGKRTTTLGILSMKGRLVKCLFSRYTSIWYLTMARRDAAREASWTLDGVRSFLLMMMKTVTRNWKVDSYAPSMNVVQFVNFSISRPGLKRAMSCIPIKMKGKTP